MTNKSKQITLKDADHHPVVSDALVKQALRDAGRAEEAEPPKRKHTGGDWESQDVKIT